MNLNPHGLKLEQKKQKLRERIPESMAETYTNAIDTLTDEQVTFMHILINTIECDTGL